MYNGKGNWEQINATMSHNEKYGNTYNLQKCNAGNKYTGVYG